MSVSLCVRGGKPCLELPDHKGHVHGYRIEVLANDARRFSVRLVKLDEQDGGTAYLVQVGERWSSCDCPWYRFRARQLGELCKHLSAILDLRPLLAALAPAAQETRP